MLITSFSISVGTSGDKEKGKVRFQECIFNKITDPEPKVNRVGTGSGSGKNFLMHNNAPKFNNVRSFKELMKYITTRGNFVSGSCKIMRILADRIRNPVKKAAFF